MENTVNFQEAKVMLGIKLAKGVPLVLGTDLSPASHSVDGVVNFKHVNYLPHSNVVLNVL
ncbi:hypothetical protein C4565_08325 [Candidatus Parcubacteria bacterium]|nr:MAG: hypothetical protein C4565_08325 [Candidatus Parcubacteria bacterium]